MIYRQLSETKGELRFYGNVSEWWISGDDFTRTLTAMEAQFTEIDIRMHCYGGSVFEGNVIFNSLLRCKAKVKIYIDGVAASMASIIIMSVADVEIAANGYIMIHCPSGVTQGTAKDHFAAAKLLSSLEKGFAKQYAARTGKSENDVKDWFDGSDHWLSADEAKELGLVTSISTEVVAIPNLAKPDKGTGVESLFARYAALLDPTATTNPNTNDLTMKKDLILKFNLTGVTENSSDADVIAALNNKFSSLEETQKAQAKTAIANLIAFAETASGQPFDEARKGHLQTIGEKAGFDALQAVLGMPAAPAATTQQPAASSTQTPPVAKIINMIGHGDQSTDADRKGWDWDKWQKEDPDTLAAMEDSPNANFGHAHFIALYKAKYKTK